MSKHQPKSGTRKKKRRADGGPSRKELREQAFTDLALRNAFAGLGEIMEVAKRELDGIRTEDMGEDWARFYLQGRQDMAIDIVNATDSVRNAVLLTRLHGPVQFVPQEKPQ